MIKKNEKRRLHNRMIRSRYRTCVKGVRVAIESGDKTLALRDLYAAESVMQKTVSKGVYHWKTAARHISRLSARIKKMPGEFVLPNKSASVK